MVAPAGNAEPGREQGEEAVGGIAWGLGRMTWLVEDLHVKCSYVLHWLMRSPGLRDTALALTTLRNLLNVLLDCLSLTRAYSDSYPLDVAHDPERQPKNLEMTASCFWCDPL